MKSSFIVCLLISVLQICIAPGVKREEKEEMDEDYNIDNLSLSEAQDREYYRYVAKVMKTLQRDPTYSKRYEAQGLEEDQESENMLESYQRITDGLMSLLSDDVKDRLHRLKTEEVEHQRLLLADNKNHMAGVERNEWNPIHHDDKETFSQNDLDKLLRRYEDIQKVLNEKRRQEFKEYEMKKELEHREKMNSGTEKERAEEQAKYEHHRKKKHEKMHKPMQKVQMEEAWEKLDGLDKEAFDYKTYFNMHDKNSDGYVDKFELETFFLHELDKSYNESDPDTDPKERQEELERMVEEAMKIDTNKDGLISQVEFLKYTVDKSFEDDEEWTPLTETKQFSEDELDEFHSRLEQDR